MFNIKTTDLLFKFLLKGGFATELIRNNFFNKNKLSKICESARTEQFKIFGNFEYLKKSQLRIGIIGSILI